jgi:hypothetical protein
LAERLGHFEFKILLSSSSAFLQRPRTFFFLYQAIQPAVHAELAQARKLEAGNFTFCKDFFQATMQAVQFL